MLCADRILQSIFGEHVRGINRIHILRDKETGARYVEPVYSVLLLTRLSQPEDRVRRVHLCRLVCCRLGGTQRPTQPLRRRAEDALCHTTR